METSIAEKVEKPVNDTVAQANAIMVTNAPTYLVAADYLKVIKCTQKEVCSTFDPIVNKACAAHKEAVTQRKKYLDPLAVAESSLKRKMIAYNVEQERIAKSEQARLAEIARKEEERKRKLIEAQAEKALEKGNTEKAEALIEKAEAVFVLVPVVQSQAVRVSGQSMSQKWSADVVDLMALAKAVAEGKAPLNFLLPNQPILNKQAQAMKDTWTYPGVKFVSENVMASRAM